MIYLTIICDIKNSRKIENREELQYTLIDTLKKANIKFKAALESPFIITVGDEWEGLLKYPCNYLEIIDFFHKHLPDISFFTGIGIGEVTIHNYELTVNQLDGPSFHKARAAIKYAKESNSPIAILFDDWNQL